MKPLIVDLFAGGGGASQAIFNATGRHPDVAVNHSAIALGVHQANHPLTKHLTCDVREVDPVEACTFDGELQPVGLLWASPDCTHFSKARGGKPVQKGIRSLADVVLVWADKVWPEMIMLENVEEFQDWGPVLENGKPCPENKGLDFRRWVKHLRKRGYSVDWAETVAADYGAPTTRKRLFLVARRDGARVVHPQPTHASRKALEKDLLAHGLKRWRSAADDVIDWTVPVPSIFHKKRPLKPKTLARIGKGIKRYVITAPRPFIVPITHTKGGNTARDGHEPIPTVTTAKGGELAVSAPTIMPVTHGGGEGRVYDPADPLRTVTSAPRGETALASAALIRTDFTNTRAGCVYEPEEPVRTVTSQESIGVMGAALIPRYGERDGQEPRARDTEEPYPAVVPTGNGGDLAATFLQRTNQNSIGSSLEDPVHTVMADATTHYQVAAHLGRQFGTAVGRDVDEPHPTVMSDGAGGKSSVVAASLTRMAKGSIGGEADGPVNTVTSHGKDGLMAASMVQANGDRVGRSADEPVTTLTGRSTQQQVMGVAIDKYYATGVAADAEEPLDTVTRRDRFGLVGVFMEQANTGLVGHEMTAPISTIVGKGCTQRLIEVGMIPANQNEAPNRALVIDFLWEQFGEPTEDEWANPTATEDGRLKFGLVMLDGAVWHIVDIGMRMLTPRELFNAQGFPPDYIIDRTWDGKPVTKTAQTSMAGNSVSPPPATAWLRANLPDHMLLKEAA